MLSIDLAHKLNKGYYIYKKLYLTQREPIIVYAPEHVDSMAFIKNLQSACAYAFQVDSCENDLHRSARFCRKHIIDKNRAVKIITPVRDPLEIMISYFFGKTHRGWIPDSKIERKKGLQKMREVFIAQCSRTPRLNMHLYWYENVF